MPLNVVSSAAVSVAPSASIRPGVTRSTQALPSDASVLRNAGVVQIQKQVQSTQPSEAQALYAPVTPGWYGS